MKSYYLLASKDTPSSKELFRRLNMANSDSSKIEFFWVKTPNELEDQLNDIDPDGLHHIFFFHWSWIVPKNIYDVYSCVVIHTANLPKGRGGSPIQNQIKDGVWMADVNAIKMIGKVDAGGIYCSETITLQGTIDEIWWTIMLAGERIIKHMVENPHLIPKQQYGEPLIYKRRKPDQSELPLKGTILDLHDHIRMLDGYGYPVTFLNHGEFRLEFTRSKMDYNSNQLMADVKITKIES